VSPSAFVTLEGVTKVYQKKSEPALAEVNINIRAGEFVFFVGASGSGKSTLLRLLIREERPTGGRVIVDGVDVGRLPDRKVPKLRRKLGTVFQDFRLLPGKTVFENISFALEVIGRPKREIAERVPEVLAQVGLFGREKRRPDQLSGGEQQRVAIARALANRPSLLLADEPTGNLDPDTSVGIMSLLDNIHLSGTTVVMATHDAAIVDRMRKRVIELDGGRVVRDQSRGIYG
jgi:cell division transport system ATP-binding protein